MLIEPREAYIEKSTFTLIAARPRQLDLTTTFTDKQDPVQTKAICALDGDFLEYCVAPPGQPRPAEFATQLGDGLTLVTLRRVGAESSRDAVTARLSASAKR